MRKLVSIFILLSVCACSTPQKRVPASTKPVCMEKTTKMQCTINIYGDRKCTCIPDETEMYKSYP